jgi:hypothetical protein
MNERIKQLAEQSGFRSDVTVSDGNSVHIVTKTEQSLDKFAELIVKECIEVIDNTSDNTKLMRVDPYQKIIWAIEEHFGVEE